MLRSRDSLYLTEQLNHEYRRAGITFRIMLIGESGLGKSTFTRALLRPYVPEHMLDEPAGSVATDALRERTTEITEIVHKVENDGFPVEITVVDCPGYGDAMDSTEWIDNIVQYVTGRFSEHYDALGNPPKGDGPASNLQRDGLVHVCLYFIAAHRLKGVDLEFMRRLQPYVNLVPLIAKSDTMTLSERDAFRRLVLSELRACGVKIFQLCDPHTERTPPTPTVSKPSMAVNSQPDSEAAAAVRGCAVSSINPSSVGPAGDAIGMPPTQPPPRAPTRALATTQPPPFAVCASEDGTRVYPWGTCCVEDPSHSDLSVLRAMLFASSMVAAKRRTLELYESSYAAARRAAEASLSERQARALHREKLIAR